MNLELISLKRLAIQKAVEITFREKSSGRAWKVSRDGILKFAFPKQWGEPLEYSPEQILQSADEFTLVSAEKEQVVGRKEMGDFLANALKSPHTKSNDEEHE
jgi:hypothetical protein